jgi:hypothetical protein
MPDDTAERDLDARLEAMGRALAAREAPTMPGGVAGAVTRRRRARAAGRAAAALALAGGLALVVYAGVHGPGPRATPAPPIVRAPEPGPAPAPERRASPQSIAGLMAANRGAGAGEPRLPESPDVALRSPPPSVLAGARGLRGDDAADPLPR